MAHRNHGKRILSRLIVTLAIAHMGLTASGHPRREFLTDREIELIQANSETHTRVKLYLEFAASRLKAAEDRLSGKESEPGDPFEFFTPEDMLDGYYRIFESVMIHLEEAYQTPDLLEKDRVQKALKMLRGATETAMPQLEILKRIAEEKGKEELWNLVNKAIDINNGAHEGAVSGASNEPAPSDRKSKRN